MIYLIIAITFGSLFAILFKIFQQQGVNALQAIGINYVVGFGISLLGNISQATSAVAVESWIIPAPFVGLFMMASFVTMNMATRSHGIAIATIAARVAFVVPVLCAYIFLQGAEPHWIASALVITSLLLIFPQQGRVNTSATQWVYPLLTFICYGITNFLLKLCQQIASTAGGNDADLSLITAVAFLSAMIFTLLYYFLQPCKQHNPLSWRNVFAGVVLGGVNVGCTFFLLKSLTVIDSGTFYPVYNIAIVTIATLVGRIGFGERLSAMQYAGIAVALCAIILFFS